MDYHFETLGDDRFQKLCQALVVSEYPDVQCFPINQADGGRDVMSSLRQRDGTAPEFTVFQVKYSNSPSAKSEREAVLSLIISESEKVKRLKAIGATRYVFMTNISGTAIPDAGSIDRVNEQLTTAFGIPSICWWRDDMERRVDLSLDLKWSYPEILKGTDVLGLLITGPLGESGRRRDSAIKSYLISQYAADEELKFKQVELQSRLLNLFIDVPVSLSVKQMDLRQKDFRATTPEDYMLYRRLSANTWERHDTELLEAAQIFLQFQQGAPLGSVVLEGAPGQGKSTITQYVCQVHRMKLLGKKQELAEVKAAYRQVPARLPFRIDLRDYAVWVSGRNPFGSPAPQPLAAGTSQALESFVAAQIHDSGGLEFSTADLAEIVSESHILIVLDGFDEVADPSIRKLLVQQISSASRRLHEQARSAQIVVTSRPSAFANSPGFGSDWTHLELQSLTTEAINDYAAKWMKAKSMPLKQQTEFKKILSNRLDQAHIRDLSRNPMQLTILLSLINTKGLSLPDKRTALYDSYIDLFFSREAEKSVVVRDHRDLLVAIHRYLAWVLQTEAEFGHSNGSIESGKLKTVLRTFLESLGHSTSLVDELFTGMVERVVALVSRTIGTYEFEVQPLREYFCARHLYETAPYSPVGFSVTGTKPDRFLSMAKNGYWLNVTRFYAGCYSTGELSSIVDGLEELSGSEDYRDTSYTRLLSSMLLTDWVFTQQPLVVKRVVEFLVRLPQFRTFLATSSQPPLLLTEGCGREPLAAALTEMLASAHGYDFSRAVANLVRVHLDPDARLAAWLGLEDTSLTTNWIALGNALDVASLLTEAHWVDLWEKYPAETTSLMLSTGRISVLTQRPDIFWSLIDNLLDQQIHAPYAYSEVKGAETPWFVLLNILSPGTLFPIFTSYGGNGPLIDLIPRHMPTYEMSDIWPLRFDLEDGVRQPFDELLGAVRDAFATDVQVWRADIDLWNSVVEPGRAAFGERPVWNKLAVLASGIKSRTEVGEGCVNLFDETKPLCGRVRYARLRAGNAQWWLSTLESAETTESKMLALLVVVVWATPKTLTKIAPAVAKRLEELSDNRWQLLARQLDEVRVALHDVGSMTSALDPALLKRHPRMAAALARRVRSASGIRHIAEVLTGYAGKDPAICKAAVTSGVEAALVDQTLWPSVIASIKAAYAENIWQEPLGFRIRASRDGSLPMDVALTIAQSPEAFPFYLLAAADKQLSSGAGVKAGKVGEVARAEGWFPINGVC